jgi:hypothetical protein
MDIDTDPDTQNDADLNGSGSTTSQQVTHLSRSTTLYNKQVRYAHTLDMYTGLSLAMAVSDPIQVMRLALLMWAEPWYFTISSNTRLASSSSFLEANNQSVNLQLAAYNLNVISGSTLQNKVLSKVWPILLKENKIK